MKQCPNCNNKELYYKREYNSFIKELGLDNAIAIQKELKCNDQHIDDWVECHKCGFYEHKTIVNNEIISSHTGIIPPVNLFFIKIKNQLKKWFKC